MEVLLLGTGGADGWPNPFCTCGSCAWARAAGVLRGQTAALVDDVLLIDLGPEAPRAALRHGRTLAGVRHVLLTHAHADHLATAAFNWREWAGRSEPLDVVGPPAAIDACRAAADHTDGVSWHVVRAGERLTVGSYEVRVLAANHNPEVGPPVLYDVGADGSRIFWGSDTGRLPDTTVSAMAGAAFDALFLEESMGDDTSQPQHQTIASWGADVDRLRANGAITDVTEVVAIHLTHANPPLPELERRLAPWGGVVHPDGATVRMVRTQHG